MGRRHDDDDYDDRPPRKGPSAIASLADSVQAGVWGLALVCFAGGLALMHGAMGRANGAPQEAVVAATFAAVFVAVYAGARAVEKLAATARRWFDA